MSFSQGRGPLIALMKEGPTTLPGNTFTSSGPELRGLVDFVQRGAGGYPQHLLFAAKVAYGLRDDRLHHKVGPGFQKTLCFLRRQNGTNAEGHARAVLPHEADKFRKNRQGLLTPVGKFKHAQAALVASLHNGAGVIGILMIEDRHNRVSINQVKRFFGSHGSQAKMR